MGYNDAFGSVLISTWVGSALYTLVALQSWRYLHQSSDDNKIRRTLVSFAIFMCTVALISEYAYVYLYTVTYWGNVKLISNQVGIIDSILKEAYIILVLAGPPLCNLQHRHRGDRKLFSDSPLLFAVSRLKASPTGLTGSRSKNISVTIVLGLMNLTALGGAFMVAVMLQLFSTLSERPKIKTATLLWTISSAVVDFSIAMTLIWQLRSMKSAFKETQTLIRRIIIGTLQTGCTTTVVAILALVTYLAHPESNVPAALEFPQGQLYALTLLYNLNLRRHNTPNATGRTTSETRGNGNNILMDGIQVHRTAIVTMDPIETDNHRARQESNGKEHSDDISIGSQHKFRVPDEF
ncbi:hypothetical protein C8J56DRAFT_882282 [Mycena floridula]|nr:hypothetical protein C8J56DRAFT_882282 [Mycena floridula]